MERDTKGLEALLGALNRSAERLQALWFSFLALTLYFIITALTTTHRMLLLEEAQALPIINLKVPLLPFYVIAPIFYLILHFYVLMMLVLLARSAASFEHSLTETLRKESEREEFRMRAENTLFLQLLVGGREEREGFNSRVLATIALITLAVVPVITLVVMQMQFLPYHHQGITWLHRAVVGVDMLLVLLLWRGYRHRQGRALPVGPMSAWTARQPGWWRRARVPSLGVLACFWLTLWEGRWAGEPWIDPMERKHKRLLVDAGVFKDRLILPNEIIVGQELLEKTQKEAASAGKDRFLPTRDFSGRNFAWASFSGADLRGVSFKRAVMYNGDYSKAFIQQSNMSNSNISRENFELSYLDGSVLSNANAEGANFFGSKLRKTDFKFAEMQGVFIYESELQGSDFQGAHLIGANISFSRAEGVDFSHAKLKSSIFISTWLRGADLNNSDMRGSFMIGAELQGADLSHSNMFGVDLSSAQLHGANLAGTDMRGAVLDRTNLFRVRTNFETRLEQIVGTPIMTGFSHRVLPNKRNFDLPNPAFSFSDIVEIWKKENMFNINNQQKLNEINKNFELLVLPFDVNDIINSFIWNSAIENSKTIDITG